MVVVDASVAVKWLVSELDSDIAEQLLRQWARDNVEIAAPMMILTEVSNALFKKVRMQVISSSDVGRLLDQFMDSGITFQESVTMHQMAIGLALRLGEQDSYDCHYLALAESLDCEFWTADRAFYDVAHEKYPRVRYIRPIPNT